MKMEQSTWLQPFSEIGNAYRRVPVSERLRRLKQTRNRARRLFVLHKLHVIALITVDTQLACPYGTEINPKDLLV